MFEFSVSIRHLIAYEKLPRESEVQDRARRLPENRPHWAPLGLKKFKHSRKIAGKQPLLTQLTHIGIETENEIENENFLVSKSILIQCAGPVRFQNYILNSAPKLKAIRLLILMTASNRSNEI